MAMPFIIHHDENIYSLQEEEKAKLVKPPRYSSKYRPRIQASAKQNKSLHKTMGFAEVPLDPPEKFLKRGGGVKPERKKKDHKCYHKVLPPLPKQGGNQTNQGSNENDTDQLGKDDGGEADNVGGYNEGGNACGGSGGLGGGLGGGLDGDTGGKGKNMKTVRKLPRYVDTRNGDSHALKPSGLMPNYVYQKNFGKLPKYLIKRIRDAALQEEMFRDAQVRRQPLCRYVTQEERAELLGGLKHNWAELQKVYQGLPVLTDTIPKANRKTKLENDLKSLEKDILLVESLPYIYVYNSNENNPQ